MKSCPLCGGVETESFETRRDRRIYHRCPACGSVFLDPGLRLNPEDEMRRYRLHENSPDDPGYRKWLQKFLDFAFEAGSGDNGVTGESGAALRVLDFGSGPVPVMAGMMRRMGYDVSIEDPFFAPGYREGPFDHITSVEVFEHLSTPGNVIHDLAKRLVPGGALSLATEFLPERGEDFENWPYRTDSTHVVFFTAHGLTAAARRAGLEMTGCDGTRYLSFRLSCPPGRPVLG